MSARTSRSSSSLAQFDWILLATVLLLCGLGVLNLFSIPGSYLTGRHMAQVYWIAIGLVGAVMLWAIDYRVLMKLAYPAYLISIALLVLTLVGPESLAPIKKGARRWLQIGGSQFQPSELCKVTLVLVLARHFHNHPSRGGYGLRQIAYPLLLALVPMAIILKQPDLGTALLLLFIAVTMLLFAKVRWTVLVTFVSIAALGVPITWKFVLKPFQRDRIEALFNPEIDQKKKGWQSRQGMLAVSSGRLTGKGFRKGPHTQFRYVPEQHNDFAFSGWAEEWGFLGCFFLLLLFFFLVVWSIYIAGHARDRLGAFLAVGMGALLFWHIVVNVGMVTRLLPVVGIPLPFYSYGGSALLTFMFGIGVLLSVSARRA
jgi:rod shape determining protein RodA